MEKQIFKPFRLLLLLFCISVTLFSNAQSITVTGTVVDETDEPMIGATVSVKGSPSIGTATNIDGKFSLNVPDANCKLNVSYIGYDPITVAVNGRSEITIKMTPNENALDEVVVVGYGLQKKVSVTGSVGTVGSKDLLKAPMQNVSNMLTGKVSGLTSIQRTGQPGSDGATMYVRGGLSGFSNASPLVLVDGIQRDLNLVNPNDIESVSVLKDAAAAIYGVKGSNGVILITTKSGQGAPVISYAASFSAVKNTAFPEFLNATEFMYYKNKALVMDGLEPIYTADIQKKVLANDPDSPWGETNWFDEIFRTAFMQQHNVSASGSTDRVRYYTSAGYMGQEGTIKKTNYERFNARANLGINVAKDLTFDVNMSGTNDIMKAPYSGYFDRQFEINPVRQAANTAPVIKKEWNGQTLAWLEGDQINVNPVAALEKPGFWNRTRWLFNSSYKLEYDFSGLWSGLKGLKFSLNFAYDYNHSEIRWLTQGYKVLAFHDRTLEAKEQTSYGIGMTRSFQRTANNYWSWQLRPTVSYNRTFGKHTFNAIFLYEKTRSYSDMLYAQGQGYLTDDPVDISLAPELRENVALPQGSYQYTGMKSYVFRLNYDFDNRYLLEFAFRRDGTYIFAPEFRWSSFPSISAGWVASNEEFLKDVQWLNHLKLRLSFAKLGDDNINPFLYNNSFQMATNSYLLGGSAISQYYASPVYAFRPVTWAHTDTYNVGLDFNILHNKLNAEFDVFYKKTNDILEDNSGAYPPSLGGYYPSKTNSGAVDNRGFEITLIHTNPVTSDFSYRLRGSVSFNRSKVLKRKVSDTYPNYRAQLGQPVGALYGFKTDGLFQTQEEIDNYPTAPSGFLRLGDIKYVDINGDGVISSAHDYVKIGYGVIPEINFSFNIDLNYRDFYLTTLWQGVAHTDYALQGVYTDYGRSTTASTVYTSAFNSGNSPKYLIEGAWTPEHTDAKYPRLSTRSNGNNAWVSDWWVINGNYLRLKNIQFGYNVPTRILQKTPFSTFNIYVAGSNMWTLSHFKYVDPESPSVSNGFYPQQATYTLGLNVAF